MSPTHAGHGLIKLPPRPDPSPNPHAGSDTGPDLPGINEAGHIAATPSRAVSKTATTTRPPESPAPSSLLIPGKPGTPNPLCIEGLVRRPPVPSERSSSGALRYGARSSPLLSETVNALASGRRKRFSVQRVREGVPPRLLGVAERHREQAHELHLRIACDLAQPG